jgi:hypothetical protein
MARIADYTIITDNWVVQATQDTFEFQVPDNLNVESRAVLGFMLDVDNNGELTIKMRLNGTQVWSWHYSDESRHPVRYFQEVIGGNVVRPGTNVLSFDGSSGDKWFAQISDAVLWIQVNA